ncbi:MAG: hypothetical protein ACYS67_00680 [Planctomycetota bacterium]|jgi:hypothetical protein
MKTIEISEELSARLKAYVVDPFDDTPEKVIGRVVDIADKAKSKWTTWEPEKEAKQPEEPEPRPRPTKRSRSGQQQVGIAL